jgi:hypothetical protein
MGYNVKVWHTRNMVQNEAGYDRYDSKGGMTEVEVYDFDAQQSYVGIAVCKGCENYNKKLGVKIALGRALKKMGSM